MAYAKNKGADAAFKVMVYFIFAILTILSVFPFLLMIVNATRSTYEIQQHAISFLPSKYLLSNWSKFNGKSFNPIRGFFNSIIVSSGSTILAVYFSTLTAYGLVVYQWKLRRAFFTFIMAIMMIPGTVMTIGFYQMIYKVGLTNNFLPLIIPAIANGSMVFFMRQYMMPSLSLEIIESARIDGAKEFFIYLKIAMPLVKPAWLTCIVTTFQGVWAAGASMYVWSEDLKTFNSALTAIQGAATNNTGAVAAGSVIMMAVPIIIFVVNQSKIVETMASSGMKD